MRDAELVEPTCPLLELVAVGATEADVVEPDAEFTERFGWCRRGVLVQSEERAIAQQVHGVMEVGVGVFVEHGIGVEQP